MQTGRKRKRRGASVLRLAVVLAAGFLTVGCSVQDSIRKAQQSVGQWIGQSDDGGPALSAAGLPRYQVGDSFSYDNGRVETVTAVKGDLVTWRNDRGFTYTAYANPILPRLSWESRSRKSKLDDLTAPTSALWPLKVGKEARFTYSNTVTEKDSGTRKTYRFTFDCRVAGTEKVTVPAGRFDTYRISCYRNRSTTGRYYGTRTWYYAPELGHYVLREDIYRSKNRPPRRVALQSALPSLSGLGSNGRQRLDTAVQGALESLASGKTRFWATDDRAYKGGVTPLRTFKSASGHFCRDYRVIVSSGSRTGSFQRTACRTQEGAWETV